MFFGLEQKIKRSFDLVKQDLYKVAKWIEYFYQKLNQHEDAIARTRIEFLQLKDDFNKLQKKHEENISLLNNKISQIINNRKNEAKAINGAIDEIIDLVVLMKKTYSKALQDQQEEINALRKFVLEFQNSRVDLFDDLNVSYTPQGDKRLLNHHKTLNKLDNVKTIHGTQINNEINDDRSLEGTDVTKVKKNQDKYDFQHNSRNPINHYGTLSNLSVQNNFDDISRVEETSFNHDSGNLERNSLDNASILDDHTSDLDFSSDEMSNKIVSKDLNSNEFNKKIDSVNDITYERDFLPRSKDKTSNSTSFGVNASVNSYEDDSINEFMGTYLDYSNSSLSQKYKRFRYVLTPSEKNIIALLLKEDRPLEYKEIAEILGISPVTVRRHINSIRKTGFPLKILKTPKNTNLVMLSEEAKKIIKM